MKTKKAPPNTSFEDLSRMYSRQAELERIADELQAKTNVMIRNSHKTHDTHMFKWLLERATENFRKQLSSNNPCLLNHFIALFKDRARSFTDSSGVSGFTLPPSKMRIVPGTKKDQEAIPGLEGKVQRIVNFDHQPSIYVRALNLYRRPNEQNSENTEIPYVIALIIKHNWVSSEPIAQKHLTDCRVALLGISDRDTAMKPDFDFDGNQDYILKLVELCTPETMFEQVFRYHGPARIS